MTSALPPALTPQASALDPAHLQILKDWLSEKRILIADSNASSRKNIAKWILDMGAQVNRLSLSYDFSHAKEALLTHHPALILSDYQLTEGNGLLLAQEVAQHIDPAQKIFVLLTSNSSQSLVAQAAEEDVDLFLLKPYSLKHAQENLTRCILNRLQPNSYLQFIREAKKALQEKQSERAIDLLAQAIPLHTQPSLALFYRAQAHLHQKQNTQAHSSYQEGLTYNSIHYKCLTGLFELLLEQKKLQEAYEVIRKISHFFPAHPKRLMQVIDLAIKTKHFQDIEEYYEVFKAIDVRSEELVRYIGAALVVTAKILFRSDQEEDRERGKQLLVKASVSASQFPGILKETIIALAEQGFVTEAQEAFQRFPSDHSEIMAVTLAQFALFCAQKPSPSQILSQIDQLQQSGIQDPYLSMLRIQCYLTLNDPAEAKRTAEEATRKWPEKKGLFEKMLAS